MAQILDKMVSADVIVLSTPVYFYSVCGQIKTFIDRTVPRYTEIADKDFYFIMTAADTNRKNPSNARLKPSAALPRTALTAQKRQV